MGRRVGRPSLEQTVRTKVRDYLVAAEALSTEEAPLNTRAVAQRLGFNRKTLKKYELDVAIARAAERQAKSRKLSSKELERRSYVDKLRQRDQEIAVMRGRCEALVAKLCEAEGNPEELWKPLLLSNRTLPHTGRKPG